MITMYAAAEIRGGTTHQAALSSTRLTAVPATERPVAVPGRTRRLGSGEFRPQPLGRGAETVRIGVSEHYGFTDEELDFIINYHINYRMGGGSDEDDDTTWGRE
jgi:hypothetical protein